jgi:5-methyltetrahydropteroyltriglutamate--homocysteine methyltransferase
MGHAYQAKTSFDGGDLDCGNGLLLLIRQSIDPLSPGELLEIRSRESSVDEDLPAWCRMTGNELVSRVREGTVSSFLVSKGRFGSAAPAVAGASVPLPDAPPVTASAPTPMPPDDTLPAAAPMPPLPALSVVGIGSWPRPAWLLRALHAHLERRMPDREFEETADDAVRLAVQAQRDAGVDAITDGEQRRDNYASFVGGLLVGCQLIPITDLLPYVKDPEEFRRELQSLDVPAELVRHPAVFGKIRRTRPLALHELRFVQKVAPGVPVKVALPGPYLLTRTMWLECVTESAYLTREELATDIVRALRAEVAHLLAAGATLVQLDEPVLSEVVFGAPQAQRSFMCGALGARRPTGEELGFASELLAAVTAGFPRERLALHVCRGNWTPDPTKALAGDYRPLLELLSRAPVGMLMLELATPRAGELEVLAALPDDKRIGVGCVDQKQPRIETVEEVLARAGRAIQLFGKERVLLAPDCGFATFADNPIASAEVAAGKLRVLADASQRLRM